MRDGRKTIIAGAVGNALEWYDFAVYGLLAPVIGKLFFPSDDSFASLLQPSASLRLVTPHAHWAGSFSGTWVTNSAANRP